MKKVRIAHCTCGLPLSSPQDAGSCQKRSRMSDITDGTVTLKKRLNQAGATPLFGGPSAQKFRGIAPARHAGSVTVFWLRAGVGEYKL